MQKHTFIILIIVVLSTINKPSKAQGWEKSYIDSGGVGSIGIGRCATETFDGGFLFTSDPGVTGNGQAAKLDSAGNVIWTTTIGGLSLVETTDSGCLVMSTRYSDFLFRKLDYSGNLVWSKMSSFSGLYHNGKINNVSDGGFIACGGVGCDAVLLRLDMNGDTIWTYKSNNPNCITFREVVETSDKGFVTAGDMDSGAYSNLYLMKTDSSGNVLWSKTDTFLLGETICRTYDNCFVTTGGLAGVTKVDGSGNLLWTRPAVNFVRLYSIKETFDKGFIAAGQNYQTNGEILLTKLDSLGYTQWSKTYYNGPDADYAESVDLCSDGGFVICGSIDLTTSYVKTYIIRTDSLGNTAVGINQIIDDNGKPVIYPNPFSSRLNFETEKNEFSEVILYDIASRKLLQQTFTNSISINTEQLEKGIYIYEVRDKKGGVEKGKVVKS